jgi:hypothetical protein
MDGHCEGVAVSYGTDVLVRASSGHLNRELHALNRRGGPNGETGGGDGGVGWRRRDRHRHDAGGLVACSTYGQTHRARTGIRLGGPLRFQAGRAGD